MLPRIDGSERVQEQRPSLPAIRDLFGEYLGKKLPPFTFPRSRTSPFSLADLGSSLPAESRETSPQSQGWMRSSRSIQDISTHAIPPGPYSPRRHSDASSYSLVSPPASSSHDQFLTLPPIQQSHTNNSGEFSSHITPTWRPTSLSRRAYESHNRAHSASAMVTDSSPHSSLYIMSRRRHTIGPIRRPSPVRFPYAAEPMSRPAVHFHSRPPSAASRPHSRQESAASPYPSPSSSNLALPPATENSPRFSESSISGEEAPTVRRKTPAKYQCQYCGKRFNRPSSLKIHHNTHTGEKPFACPFPGCGRHFSVMSNMRRHARIHGEVFPQLSREDSEDIHDQPSPPYSSASSTHATPVMSHSHLSSASPSPSFHPLSSLPSSSRRKGRRNNSISKMSHPYDGSLPPSSEDEGLSSPER